MFCVWYSLWVHKKCGGSCVGMGFRQAQGDGGFCFFFGISALRPQTSDVRSGGRGPRCGHGYLSRLHTLDPSPLFVCLVVWRSWRPFGVWRQLALNTCAVGVGGFWSAGLKELEALGREWWWLQTFFLEGTVETLGLHLWHWFSSL